MFLGLPPLMRVAVRGRRDQFVVLALLSMLALLYFHRDSDPSVELPSVYTVPSNSTTAPSSEDEFFNRPPVLTSPRQYRPAELPFSHSVATKAPEEEYTKALVIARTKKEDISWLNDTVDGTSITDGWQVYTYTTDDLTADHHTPLNKGREAMAYLTYIIEHYSAPSALQFPASQTSPPPRSSSLPDIILFMHAHRLSWHDNLFSLSSPQTLATLHLSRVARLGYANLRCQWEPGCPSHIHPSNTGSAGVVFDPNKPEEAVFASAWAELFPSPSSSPLPEVLSQPCCAQFAVTRVRVLARPLSAYVSIRDWLLTTPLEDQISGRVLEYLYQVLWAGRAVDCPAEHACYCEGYGICFGGRGEFEGYMGKRGEADGLRERIGEMVGREAEVFGREAVEGAVERMRRGEDLGGMGGGEGEGSDAPVHAAGHSRRSEDQGEEPQDDAVAQETDGAEDVQSDIVGNVEEAETTPPAESPGLPDLATLREIVLLKEQVETLERWLEQELAAAKERGQDPLLRALEADDPVYKG